MLSSFEPKEEGDRHGQSGVDTLESRLVGDSERAVYASDGGF